MTVKNFRKQHVERIQYFTPDGVAVTLHDPPDKAVLFYEGDGLPDPEYDTTKGPYQDGYKVLGMREPQREIDLTFRWNACSRDEYWDMRRTLINYLRPNRTDVNNPTPGVLRRILSTGEIFDLDCYLTKGPTWKFPRNWDHWSVQESLTFTAYNPILYDPTLYTDSVNDFVPTYEADIVIPLMFDFIFGETNPVVSKTITLNYLGNWESYPTIIINGPFTQITIENQVTLEKISLIYPASLGEVITIDLAYDRKTIQTNLGNSLLGYVTEDSDLTAFSIKPDPLVPGGINILDVTAVNGTNNTSVEVQYLNRYIGI